MAGYIFRLHGLRPTSAVLLAAASIHAHAVEMNVEAGYGAEYTDNVGLTTNT